jgi:hypothetical protein
MRSRWVGSIIALGFAVAACGGDDEDTATAAATTPQTADLAPSQTTPSTVAAPDLPPPCTLEQLTFASRTADEPGVLLVDIANTAEVWCEANLGASVGVTDGMEPDVWIDPGAIGQLRVEIDTTSCDAPAPVDTLGLDVNGEPVPVPIDPIDVCAVALTALYPL